MQINFNVKVKGGPRTKASVEVHYNAKQKTIEFANGAKVTESEIADFIQLKLTQYLQSIESEGEK